MWIAGVGVVLDQKAELSGHRIEMREKMAQTKALFLALEWRMT